MVQVDCILLRGVFCCTKVGEKLLIGRRPIAAAATATAVLWRRSEELQRRPNRIIILVRSLCPRRRPRRHRRQLENSVVVVVVGRPADRAYCRRQLMFVSAQTHTHTRVGQVTGVVTIFERIHLSIIHLCEFPPHSRPAGRRSRCLTQARLRAA